MKCRSVTAAQQTRSRLLIGGIRSDMSPLVVRRTPLRSGTAPSAWVAGVRTSLRALRVVNSAYAQSVCAMYLRVDPQLMTMIAFKAELFSVTPSPHMPIFSENDHF